MIALIRRKKHPQFIMHMHILVFRGKYTAHIFQSIICAVHGTFVENMYVGIGFEDITHKIILF
jgi:hypothetical protein